MAPPSSTWPHPLINIAPPPSSTWPHLADCLEHMLMRDVCMANYLGQYPVKHLECIVEAEWLSSPPDPASLSPSKATWYGANERPDSAYLRGAMSRSPESQSQAPGQQHRRRLSTCGAKQILGPAPGLPRRGRGGGALQPVHLRTCRWSSRKLTAEESTERTAERGDHVWQRKLIRNGLETGALKELANAKASLQGEENAVETSMVTNAAEKMTGHLLTELYTRGSLKELRDHKVSLGCISELFPKGSNASFDSKEQQTGGKSILAEGMMCGKMQRQWGTKQANAPKTRIPCLQVENSAADKDRMQAFILQRWCFVAPRLVLVVQLSGLHLCWGFISAEELKDIVLCIP
ncbi:uncharacterized protein LOC110257836 [Sus scrofa]|uniref:uncharacterized protein LOC110257836 n=1 Tax=Sus scrofa TaxID=9823 RepID=UPI000A2B00DD|nr:uncharacterized protein LOC110257836 [Sus scrofa]